MRFSTTFASLVLLIPLLTGEALGQRGGKGGRAGKGGKGGTGTSSSSAAASSSTAVANNSTAPANNNNNGDPQTSLSTYYATLPRRWRRF